MAKDGIDDYPSSAGQRELARVVAEELREAGVRQVEVDEHAVVMATVPGTVGAGGAGGGVLCPPGQFAGDDR